MSVAETPRLRLRLLGIEDAPFILELLTDPAFLANVGDRGVHDLDSAARYIEQGPGASYTQFGFCLYLVERKSDGRSLGMCGLLRRDSHPDVEIGFAMLPLARRQGYTAEAAAATVQLAAKHFAVPRLVALTAPDNEASIRTLERLGFRFERMVSFTSAGGISRFFVLDLAAAAPGPSVPFPSHS